MNLETLLAQKKPAILERWFRLIIETYPPDTARFLLKERDRFANPVGQAISEGIETVFDQLLVGLDQAKTAAALDGIIRIRAVQDFTASQGVSFVFLLKQVIRQQLTKELSDEGLLRDLMDFEARIDALALIAFEVYMTCREKLWEIKVSEAQRLHFRLLKRAKMIVDDLDEASDNQESH